MATGGSSNERFVRSVAERGLAGVWFDQKEIMTELTKAEYTTRNRMRKTLPTRGELTAMLKRAPWLEKNYVYSDGRLVDIQYRVKGTGSEAITVPAN